MAESATACGMSVLTGRRGLHRGQFHGPAAFAAVLGQYVDVLTTTGARAEAAFEQAVVFLASTEPRTASGALCLMTVLTHVTSITRPGVVPASIFSLSVRYLTATFADRVRLPPEG